MATVPPTPGRVRFVSPAASSPASTSTASAASHSTAASSEPDLTSSLAFLTTQLQSHGFLPPSSLLSQSHSLARLPTAEQQELQRCLMQLLQQRVEDMRRLEEVGGELRTREWESGRWKSLCAEEREGRERAEREVEQGRARLAALAKQHSTEQAAHKQTASHLTRAQSALQTTRAHAQAELRKREKEVERMGERWARVAGEQARLGALGSGLRMSAPLSASTVSVPTDPLLESQLQETEEARARLVEENDALRSALLSAANGLQSLLTPGAAPMLASTLFTPGMVILGEGADWQASNARGKLLELCGKLRERLSAGPLQAGAEGSVADAGELAIARDEIDRLAGNVRRLEEELAELRGREERGQRLMEQYAMQATRGRVSDAVLDRDTPPDKRAALQEQTRAVEQERAQMTAAAVELGRERAELQRQRAQLDDERRKAALRALLDDLPATPTVHLPSSTPAAVIRVSLDDGEDAFAEPALRTPSPAPRRRKRRSQSPAGKRASPGPGGKAKGRRGPAVFPRKSAMRAAADYRPAVGSPLKTMMTFAASSSSVGSGSDPRLSVAGHVGKGKQKENAPPIDVTPLPALSLKASRESTALRTARDSVGLRGADSMRLSASHLVGGARRKSVLGGGAQRVWRG
ncbi:hypothetical protein CALVIDRAFT_557295 [Calocera viscosa TUFC12733]|uniref:Uncharacterized protein n=1 Tax=Calocera viscosa (strain TUFC12733) TaxID=1330018 RepID=A0A167IQW9_CALVF|nr:hypothetical protein CALVIDRAFT_557295 [Calocera viscosa TUFC12733]